MKIRKMLSIILSLAMVAGLFVPAGGANVMGAGAKLKLARKKVTVKVKESVKVKYTSGKKAKAVSKNKKIAKVKVTKKNIVITGVKKGKTSITVKAAGKKAVIKVTVKKDNTGNSDVKTGTATPKPTTDPKLIEEALKNMDPYALSINRFSCSTFNGVKSEENSFVSPFSLYMALAMLLNGADGNTKSQMLSVMGITDIAGFNNSAKGIMGGSSDEKVILNIANGLWLGNRFEMASGIENDFIGPIREYYNGEVKRDVNMSSQDLVNDVNNWADEKTNGMIKKVLNDPLPEESALLLANAVYFLGDWRYPFSEENTREQDFNGVNGRKTVPMMSRGNVYGKYFANDQFVGASIPYGTKGNYVMDILMSADTATTAGKVWNGLSVDDQMKVLANFSVAQNSKKIDLLQLPKFEMEGSYSKELIDTLKKLGMTDVFVPFVSDLSKIGKDLYVDKILQKTRLKVNEKGTEASAVTVIVAVSATSVQQPVERIEFIVDRPFIFTIRDTVSGMILFMGEVNNLL